MRTAQRDSLGTLPGRCQIQRPAGPGSGGDLHSYPLAPWRTRALRAVLLNPCEENDGRYGLALALSQFPKLLRYLLCA